MADSSNASNWLYTKLLDRIKGAKLGPFKEPALVSRLQKANKITDPAERGRALLAIADEFLKATPNSVADSMALDPNIKEVKGFVEPQEVEEEQTKEEAEEEPKDTKPESFGGKLADSANKKRKNDYTDDKSTTECENNPKQKKTEQTEPTVWDKVEKIVKDCATQAEDEINRQVFNRKNFFSTRPEGPVEKECDEQAKDPKTGKELYMRDQTPKKRKVQLGEWKHEAAEKCIKSKLTEQDLNNVCKVEQSFNYQGNATVGGWDTIRPDVIVHDPGNPSKVQCVFDMKFPCPPGTKASWRYMKGAEFENKSGPIKGVEIGELKAKGITQDKLYAAVLGLNASQLKLVAPR